SVKNEYVEVPQTWKETPEEDLKPEDYQQFKNLGSACLTRGDNVQLLKFVQDEKNQVVLLLPDELLHSLLELIEDIDPAAISETVIALVPHLKTEVLLRMEGRKAARVGLVLAALQKQLLRLPVPYTQQQEEADEYGLCCCCTALAEFIKSFVEEVKGKDGNSVTTAEDEELRTELLKFCMRSLREPLLEAELNRNRKSSLWIFATEIMVTLPAIQVSLSELLFFSSLKKSTVMDKSQSKESRACLAYLLFVQLITIDSFPAVFSPVFVLQCNMEYINELLSRYAVSTTRSEYGSLLTDCPMQHLRESGLQVFQLFINKLDAEAKHKFFRCMLKVSNHAGVESYIVKNIKNQVEFSMKVRDDFLSLLGLVLSLPQGAETDLLNSMDRIMESLNLLRYLLIRDKEPWSNTDVWEELGRMKDEYLKMLRVCISISRPYYSAELKALREDQKLKAKGFSYHSFHTMNHLCCPPPEARDAVLQSALVTFDLMESLIVRIEEITEEKLKIQN
uniref:Glomulin, FKBP associated protein b n=1 Tax=Seriola dumerili TaxID=41447 RepID=A0A3B4VJJ2_SERDU